MKIVFLTWFLLLWGPLALSSWDLNDVSYLMPLPLSVEANSLLTLQTPARGGVLLDAQTLRKIPNLALDLSREEQERTLRVLAVRLDPCFPLPTPLSCQAQIRLVWQPLEMGPQGRIRTVDAALHSFHVLSVEELSAVLVEIKDWKKKWDVRTEALPLQVHPAWAQRGDGSAALKDFQNIVLKYAGMGNLSRVTAMVLRGAGDMWVFAGFEYTQGGLQVFKVPRLDRSSQGFVNMALPKDHFSGGGMMPAPMGVKDRVDTLVRESLELGEGTEDLIREQIGAAFRMENPHVFNPENLDCVSCHVAQPAIQWALNKKPELQVEDLWREEIYRNYRYNLSNTSAEVWNTHSIRAFGYFEAHVAISQRVINESAEVADSLNAQDP